MKTATIRPTHLVSGHEIIENGRVAATVLTVTPEACSKGGVHVKTGHGTWCYPRSGSVEVTIHE